jgi:hypothetical protein
VVFAVVRLMDVMAVGLIPDNSDWISQELNHTKSDLTTWDTKNFGPDHHTVTGPKFFDARCAQ